MSKKLKASEVFKNSPALPSTVPGFKGRTKCVKMPKDYCPECEEYARKLAGRDKIIESQREKLNKVQKWLEYWYQVDQNRFSLTELVEILKPAEQDKK